jgi:predicted component of type VI protein secretion system
VGDATSQCLLGLVGLGIPGTAEQVATPVSRFWPCWAPCDYPPAMPKASGPW